mmetsp:Transcript_28031/g.82068  ORF Transcript_28031/g.82068 Transcript_28031/m.82068 type:complete len:200 (-) Transcript_28031:649-1248(-)
MVNGDELQILRDQDVCRVSVAVQDPNVEHRQPVHLVHGELGAGKVFRDAKVRSEGLERAQLGQGLFSWCVAHLGVATPGKCRRRHPSMASMVQGVREDLSKARLPRRDPPPRGRCFLAKRIPNRGEERRVRECTQLGPHVARAACRAIRCARLFVRRLERRAVNPRRVTQKIRATRAVQGSLGWLPKKQATFALVKQPL